MTRRIKLSSRLAFPLAQAVALMAASFVLRIILAVAFSPAEPQPWADYSRAFLVGLHFDLAVALGLFAPLALWCGLISPHWWAARWQRILLTVVSIGFWGVLVFLLAAEIFFFDEFLSRYNTVAIDYLVYPHEVFVNVWESYPVVRVVGCCLLLAVGIVSGSWWWTRRRERAETPGAGSGRAIRETATWLIMAVLLGWTVHLEEARFSRERILNELANNTIVSGLTAAWTRNLDYLHFYPTVTSTEAFAHARQLLSTPGAEMDPATNSIQRHISGDATRPRLNVIILLEESLGSEFWGALGRTEPSLMPRMDSIATNESMLFDNLYADGNRTIRGMEGILCSLPPLPGDSIVVRDRSEHVETLARVLQRDGYQTTFIYAGRGLFDGLRAFLQPNGFERFIEQKDFIRPVYTTIWGVCNEDLYDRAIEEMRQQHRAGKPFFIAALSVSNHKPFTYPPGRIPENPGERRRGNAVKYTDYALGRFFDAVKREPFWTNTIFAVVADHGARVYGSQTIPIRSYEIPLVVAGPAVAPAPTRVHTLGCQLDIAPTLLGMIGRPYDTVFFGHDLRRGNGPGRVLLNHNRSIGIYDDERLVVFSLNRKIEYFQGNPRMEQMHRVNAADGRAQQLEKDATALFQVADELYMNRRYRVEPTTGRASAAPKGP